MLFKEAEDRYRGHIGDTGEIMYSIDEGITTLVQRT